MRPFARHITALSFVMTACALPARCSAKNRGRSPSDPLSLLAVEAKAPAVPMCTKLEDRGTYAQSVEIPCSQMSKQESGGAKNICEIDPSACPKAPVTRRPHPAPPQLIAIEKQKSAPAEQTRILDMHRVACARGNGSECMRNIELELMRFPYLVYDDERNSGVMPAVDPRTTVRDLCKAGTNAEACAYVAIIEQDLWAAIRSCDLGSPRGCAIAGHRLRTNSRAPDAPRAPMMLARACSGGFRWACGMR